MGKKNKKITSTFSNMSFKLNKTFITPYAIRLMNTEFVDLDNVFSLEPPYLVCPNHVGFWDPFLINSPIDYKIHYVVSDVHYRKPSFKRWYLRKVGSIPKTKAMSDMESVREILKVIKSKDLIGIFPEGKRNWDGVTLPLIYTTAKLIKKLKLPVVTPLLKGMFLSHPRWSKEIRNGKVIIEYRLAFTPEEINDLSIDQIYTKLEETLKYNEYDYQREAMVPYKSKKPAEHLELVLFICPSCESTAKMKSVDDKFFCPDCGYTIRYDDFGFMHAIKDKTHFDNIRDWNLWQQAVMKKRMRIAKRKKSTEHIIRDKNAKVMIGFRLEPMSLLGKADIALYYDRLILYIHDGEPITFKIENISGTNVQDNEKLEFYHNEKLYHFEFDELVSAYKWMSTITQLQMILKLDPEDDEI